MRNDGKTEWPADTTLIMTNGDEMAAQPTHIGSVQPEMEVEFAIDLVAPSQPGRYSTYFRMRSGENNRFGHKIWADILVEEPIEEPVEEIKIESPKVVFEAPDADSVQQNYLNAYPCLDAYVSL